ncbi:Galactoside 2-alpha-L-fucosyltransferase [Morus notabilis]|uniref:Fucosyltransferase n=1 Tax=Morus notabilis TaxID=981085 RepID=W9QYR2_9ROSA|nr:Galactoside 2-alpha-L-fucosyltransferase [Morus notabilis]
MRTGLRALASTVSRGDPENEDLNIAGKSIGSENNPSGIADIPVDKLLNGLLVPGFDEGSCLSRLRSYEALHERCGPYTESYNKTVKLLGVLLVDRGVDMTDLFCEPFPDASWFLPADFSLKNQFASFGQETPQRYGKMLRQVRASI